MPYPNHDAGFKYDSTTISHRNALVRAIHRRRYGGVIRLIEKDRPGSVLDFGSGTGSLIIQLMTSSFVPARIAAYEPGDRRNAADLKTKLDGLKTNSLDFSVFFDLDIIDERFDMICSAGVFEHLPKRQRLEAYRLIRGHLSPNGTVVIQVPIMIGMGLVARECARFALKGRKFLYSPVELARVGLLALPDRVDGGRHDMDFSKPMIHSHRGFDHRVLQSEIQSNGFDVIDTFTEPFGLPVYVAHSYYILCRPRNLP